MTGAALWPCGCLRNDAGAHRAICPDYITIYPDSGSRRLEDLRWEPRPEETPPVNQTTEMTAAEQAEATAMLAALHEHGYQDMEQHGRIRPGTRIRHVGHQWTEAYNAGTGVVVAVTEKPNSPWAKTWGRPDVELIALWDRDPGWGRLSQVAQYHVEVTNR